MPPEVLTRISGPGEHLGIDAVREAVAQVCPASGYRGKRVLLIVPDATRTCPLGLFFAALFDEIGTVASELDVLIALGTHPPMTEDAICRRLEISAGERAAKYRQVRFFNHEWSNPSALVPLGIISAAEINTLSGGLFAMDVSVNINRRIFDYDQLIIAGPVFPHEVVGFSGSNKYLFPGISGPEVLNFFHWLGAVVTNPMIIGNKYTPVRAVVDRAATMVSVPKLCFCMVVDHGRLAGLFAGSPEAAWDQASDLSHELHIAYKDTPFHTVLSCAPPMYTELWVAGKCMYKLEPVVADGGELIIYAPHIRELSLTHGTLIRTIGYHCRDYFLKQWNQFKHLPWGVLAHSTHVRGIGVYERGVESCRVKVTLATGIPKDACEAINLGYRDPATINLLDYSDRERDGVLLVPDSGEILYHLRHPPKWSRQD
ncbi:MAG: lactate racemase domain-containing protein [Candidatus Binataceae bacterium]